MCDEIAYKRLTYSYKGRKIYEWEQSLEDINVYIELPPGVVARMLECKITATRFVLGLRGNPPFMDERFEQNVDSDESVWSVQDGELHVALTKGSKGVTWGAVFQGHASTDPFTQSEVKKALMLERFQQENPGFDFSGAEFNGAVPDPKTFMGGVGYNKK